MHVLIQTKRQLTPYGIRSHSKPPSCLACRVTGRMAIHAMEARGFHSTFYSAFINISSLLHKSSLPLHSQSPYLCQPKPEGALERCQCQALHSISEWLSLLRTGFHGQNTFYRSLHLPHTEFSWLFQSR